MEIKINNGDEKKFLKYKNNNVGNMKYIEDFKDTHYTLYRLK